VIGDALSAAECPALWKRVEETATKLGALAPEHIVIGLDPNFFVTEAAVICSSGELTGRTLYCSLPLCRILSASELTSILGHELSHFSGLDTRFSKRFYPVYRGTASSMAMLGEAADERGPASIALLPAIAILGYFLECFSLAESRFSRERELAADVAAAGVTSPVTAAAALVKVHAFSGLWQALHEAAVAAVREGGTLANLSKTYFQAAAENAQPSVLDGIVDTHLAHPTDSHPSLAVRLNALEIDIGDVTADALNVTPSDPAIALVAGAEAREEAITAAYQRLLAQALELESAAEPQTRTVGAA
jgi:Zn-dependent protease with chaperone function